MVELLIKNGCKVNLQDNKGLTALHCSTDKGDAEMVELLCTNKCNLDIQDKQKRTAAHLYSEKGKLKLLEVLCLYKADLSIRNNYGQTPLIACTKTNEGEVKTAYKKVFNPTSIDVIRLLVATGAD
eukprot:UN34113